MIMPKYIVFNFQVFALACYFIISNMFTIVNHHCYCFKYAFKSVFVGFDIFYEVKPINDRSVIQQKSKISHRYV